MHKRAGPVGVVYLRRDVVAPQGVGIPLKLVTDRLEKLRLLQQDKG